MLNMSACDWILAAFLLLAVFYGWRQGTVNVIGRIGAIIIAYLAARRYSMVLAVYLSQRIHINLTPAAGTENPALLSFISLFTNTDQLVNGFLQTLVSIVIFVVVAWIIRALARAITSAFGHGLLAKINHALGAVVALIIGALIILILADIVAPALFGMGLTEERGFFDSSLTVVPLIEGMSNLL